MNLEDVMLSGRRWTPKHKRGRIPRTREMVTFVGVGGRKAVLRARVLAFSEHRVPVREDGTFLEVDGGDASATA